MTEREQMITDIYNSKVIHKMIQNIIKDRQECQDFMSIFYEQVCLINEDKLLSMKGKDNDLRYFLCRLITNQYKSKSSIFYREVKKNKYAGTLNNDHYLSSHVNNINKRNDRELDNNPYLTTNSNGKVVNELADIVRDSLKHVSEEGINLEFIIDEESLFDNEDDLRFEAELEQDIMVELVKEEIHQLHWYERDIVERHLYGKQKLPAIAKELEIPYSSIWSTYSKTVKKIKNKIENMLNENKTETNDNTNNCQIDSNNEDTSFSIFMDKIYSNS